MDSKARSVTKAITWRIFALFTTVLLAFCVTFEISVALTVGILDSLTKMVLYYFHERAWNSTRWGRLNSVPELPEDEAASGPIGEGRT